MLCFGEEGCFGEVRLVLGETAEMVGELAVAGPAELAVAEPAGFGDLGR